MKTTEMLSKIKALLNANTNLAQQTLDNGTIIEAESFEAGQSVFIVTDDERVALPIGEYKLEDGSTLIVEEEGIIASISAETQAEEEEVKVEAEDEIIETEVPEEVAPEVEAIVEAVVEVVAPAIEEVKEELKKLKKKFEDSYEKKEDKEEKKEEMSRKFKHSPERRASKKEQIKFSTNRAETTLDRVLKQLNK
jgi:hypothetical protein